MKARIKATGHIVDVELSHYIGDVAWYKIKGQALYSENELEFIDAPEDYWTRLEHQYAGMAMQALLSSNIMMEILSRRNNGTMEEEVAMEAFDYAHALVEKYKKEEK